MDLSGKGVIINQNTVTANSLILLLAVHPIIEADIVMKNLRPLIEPSIAWGNIVSE